MSNPYEPPRSDDWSEGVKYGQRIARHKRLWEIRAFAIAMSGVIYEHVRDIVWQLKNLGSPNANQVSLFAPLAIACLIAWVVHLIEKNW